MPKYLDGEGLSYFWGKIKSLFTNVVYQENDDGTSGEASIPSIDIDNTPTANSSNLVTSGGVYSAINNTVGNILTILESI